jgi:hypothetical protein
MLVWLGDNWGSLLSLAGLILTIYALAAANRAASSAKAAEIAAQETKRAMTQQNITHSLGETKRLVAELATLISGESFPAAQIRSQDLGQSLRYLVKRWGGDSLGTESVMNLVEAQTQTDSITEKLHLPPVNGLSKTESRRILLLLQRISSTVTAEHAAAEKRGEGNGYQR